MPVKSKAQMRKFAQMLQEGKISQVTYDEWTEGADYNSLPEKVEVEETAPVDLVSKPAKTRRKSSVRKPRREVIIRKAGSR